MRMARRLAKFVFWLVTLVVAILSGGLWYMYTYMTDSATAARMIREYAVKYLRDSELIPGHVRLRPLAGELVLREVLLQQKIDGLSFMALRIPWLQMQFSAKNGPGRN